MPGRASVGVSVKISIFDTDSDKTIASVQREIFKG